MLRRLMTSLSKPPLAIFFVKDKWTTVISYILLMTFIMIIPSIIYVSIDKEMPVYLYEEVYDQISTEFRFNDVTLANYQLNYTESKTVSFDIFDLVIGEPTSNYRLSFVFQTNGIGIFFADQRVQYYTYQELNLESHDFSSQERADLSQLSIVVKDIYELQTFIFVADIIAQYVLYLTDFLIVILIMAVLSKLLSPYIVFPFKDRFKLSTYLSTIYVFANFILILLGLSALNYFSILFAYIYHHWAYRTIKIIPKGVNPDGK